MKQLPIKIFNYCAIGIGVVAILFIATIKEIEERHDETKFWE